jgi:hypothetical protein
MPSFTYTVDGENQATTSHELTAVQILTNAGIDGFVDNKSNGRRARGLPTSFLYRPW